MSKLYSPTYRPELDGLRTVMMIIVIMSHAFPEYAHRGGYLAIDVFFVISGYLMTQIIVRSMNEETFSFREFYRRRILRIIPVLFIVLAVMLVIGCLFYPHQKLVMMANQIAAGSFFIANSQIAKDAIQYSGTALEFRPFIHLWTLAVEEQFYLLAPLYFWICTRLKWDRKLCLLIPALISFGIYLYYFHHWPTFAFYSTEGRIWQILAGGILAFYSVSSERRNIYSTLGVFLILFSLCLTRIEQWQGAELVTLAGTLLLLSADSGAWIHRKIFSQPLIVKLGQMSYPVYLWHWPVLAAPRVLLGEELNWYMKIMLIFVSLFLGWLSREFIDIPVRKNGRAWVWLTLILGLGAIALYIGSYSH